MPDFFTLRYYRNYFSLGHERTLRAKKNIGISILSRAVSIIISFLIVPLTLNYVGKIEYGIWMTLSSIIHWFTFFDIGLGNGLRNKLAEALAKDDKETARIYISSSYALISGIAVVMFMGFYLTAKFIPWNKVFNTNLLSNEEFLSIVVLVFLLFCVDFVFKILSSILQAMQKYWINDIIGIIAQFTGLAGIFFLVKTTEGSLFNLCLVYAGKSPFVMIFATIILFCGSLLYLRPAISYMKIRRAFPLINLGFKFFINQILYIIVTQSSVILVAQFFGPEEVTVYNLAVRYMTIATMIYMMVLTPFLSAFTEAYTKNEFEWIRQIIDRMHIVWLGTSLITIIMAAGYKLFFSFWVGDAIKVPLTLIIALAVSGIIHTYYNKYSLFLNGIGKIQIQLYLLGLQALLFIPLSYLFYIMGFKLVSIVAAQIILYGFTALMIRIQYRKILESTATGVWNR